MLRPEPGASATLKRAHDLGLEAVALPLFELRAIPWRMPQPTEYDALLLTSANAVRSAGNQLAACRSLPVHAVGQATADAVLRGGLTVASVGRGGVDDLLSSLPTGLRLLHLCGQERQTPGAPKQRITAVPVYTAEPLARSDLQALKGAVVMVHSPRAGDRLAQLLSSRGTTAIAGISSAAADACGSGWQKVSVADRPHDVALLSLAARMCQES